jgi:putative ABC transport system ATP-binding protein
MRAVVEVVDAVKHFRQGDRDVAALNGVTLGVPSGQLLAIMGASGSGKSTLLHLMAGLAKSDGGVVLVNGTDLASLNDKQLTLFRRKHIGLVFQSFNLIPTLSAEENVALPLTLAGRVRREDRARVERLLERVGLTGRRTHRPAQLSGGQQQRVAIARALVGAPAVLFADEPTGNLDSAAGQAVLTLLRDAVDLDGQTTLMVTHDPRAAAHADRVVLLADGLVVADLASPSEGEVVTAMAEVAR